MADVKIEAIAEVDDAVKGIEKLDKTMGKTDKRLDDVRQAFKDLDKEVKTLKKDINDLNAPMHKAEQMGKALRNTFDKAVGTVKSVGKGLIELGKSAGIAAGILYAMGRALEEVAKRGEALGQRGLTKQWNGMKAQAQELIDTLLTMKIAGTSTFQILERFAGGLWAGLKLVGVAAETVAGGIDLLITDFKRLMSVASSLTGGVDSYTQAMYEADRAQIFLNHNQRIGLIWSEQLTESYEKQAMSQKGLRQSYTRTGDSLIDLINKARTLNNTYSKQLALQDAIRKGDPRAYMDALASGSSGSSFSRGTPGNGSTANRPGASPRDGMGNMSVQVFIGDESLDPHIERVVVNGIDRGQKKKRDTTANSRKGH